MKTVKHNYFREMLMFMHGYASHVDNSYAPYILGKRHNLYYIFSPIGKLLVDEGFEKIKCQKGYFVAKLKSQWGIVDKEGEIVLSFEYDDIKDVTNKQARVLKNGIEKDVVFVKRKDYPMSNHRGNGWESPTYERYAGSYAQDEMGYSDDDIDTIFDGDPDAYWNID